MPELPEVEVKRKLIERMCAGKTVTAVEAPPSRVLRNVTQASLRRGLVGRKLVAARRRAKFVLIEVGGGSTLLIHFGMTGDAVFVDGAREFPLYWKARFVFAGGGSIFYTDPRMFGRIALYPTLDQGGIPDLAGLGPEPLERSFTLARFGAALRSRNTTVHQALMDQRLIAGIGNIYSDEITWQARVLPYRKTLDLDDGELRLLYEKMKWTLRRAVALDAELDRRKDIFLIPHRGKGGRCPNGHLLESRTIGGRTSWYCPVEQE